MLRYVLRHSECQGFKRWKSSSSGPISGLENVIPGASSVCATPSSSATSPSPPTSSAAFAGAAPFFCFFFGAASASSAAPGFLLVFLFAAAALAFFAAAPASFVGAFFSPADFAVASSVLAPPVGLLLALMRCLMPGGWLARRIWVFGANSARRKYSWLVVILPLQSSLASWQKVFLASSSDANFDSAALHFWYL